MNWSGKSYDYCFDKELIPPFDSDIHYTFVKQIYKKGSSMEKFNHDLHHLFSQLGMDNSKEFIEDYLQHHSLDDSQTLADAPFLKPSQQAFIKESQNEDADWCEVIDQFDALLRK